MDFDDLCQVNNKAEQTEMDMIQEAFEQEEVEQNEMDTMQHESKEEGMRIESAEDPDKLDYEEIAQMREAFNLFDKNQNGTIEASELVCVMRILRYDPTEEQVQTFLAAADLSGDSLIDFREFVLMIRKNKRKVSEEQLLRAFKVFDKDKNGLIDKFELKMILTSLDDNCAATTEQIEEMIRDADLDKDGYINYEELIKYWKST